MHSPEPKNTHDASLKQQTAAALAWEAFPDLVLLLSPLLIVQAVNPAFTQALGYMPEDVTGKPLTDILSEEDHSKAATLFREVQQAGVVKDYLLYLRGKDGTLRRINWSVSWSANESLMVACGRENSMVAGGAHPQSAKEHLFKALVENSFDLLALTDAEGRYLYVSDTFEELFGFTKQELLGSLCFSYMHPDDLPGILADNTVLHSHAKKVYVSPYRFRTAAGNWLWMESVVTNQLLHPDIRGIVVSARDITSRFNTEARLKELQLLEALREGEEKERSRIARDLHDEISGMIAAAKMHFSSLTLQTSSLGYQQGMQLLEQAALQVRRTSHNLMPEILLENGLAAALQHYCSNVNSSQLMIQFVALGVCRRYSSPFELSLYRIAQELIGNLLKHSGATTALVQLSQYENVLSLTIEDNGKGFCTEEVRRKGTGLYSIHQRVAAMRGTIDIQSERGKGTHIYLEFEI